MSTLSLDPRIEFDESLELSEPSDAKSRRRRPRRPGVNLLAFAIYCVISLAADLPIWPGDPSRVPTMLGEDIFQTAWFLEWTPYALLHGQNLFQTDVLNYPAGVDLAQNTGMPLLGLVTAPLTLLVNPIASENLLRFLGFALSAYAAYWVLRKFVSWAPAAFVGGLLYGFSPYMLTQGSIHLNLMFVPLPPLLLYGLFELLVTQRTRPLRRGLLLGVVAAAQYFISAEVLATTLLIAAVAIVILVLVCVRDVPSRTRHALIGILAATGVLAVFIAYPTYLMFFGHAHYSGPAQGFSNVFNADLLGAVFPSPYQLFDPHQLAHIGSSFVGGQTQEDGSYLGIPLIALCVGIVIRYWRKLWPVYVATVALACWLLSLGPRLIVNGKAHSLLFSLPFHKLDHLPGVDNILPVRFSLYVVFFAAILVALALDEAWRTHLDRRIPVGRSRPWTTVAGRCLVGLVGLATVVTLLPAWPYDSKSVRINNSEQPAALRIIPTGSVVVTYPYPTTFYDAPMLWQALDAMRFKLVGGYALVPDKHGKATIFPNAIKPSIVESMLINSVSPVTVPGYPVAIATGETIAATNVAVLHPSLKWPRDTARSVSGVVIAAVASKGMIYIRHGYSPIAIHVSPTTRYIERWTTRPSLSGIVPGQLITVTGTPGPGTVTPAVVGQLREFLRNAHAKAVIIGLGTTDAGVIANWFRNALGPPNRAGGGAEIWTNVNVTDRQGA